MSSEILERHFAAMGARLRIEGPGGGMPRLDVGSDLRGEYFELRFPGDGPSRSVEVIDVAPADRHLLLLVRGDEEKSKFLCGHDERHWFVAAVPEAARGVTGVATAKDALQPALVREAVERARPKDRFRRRNAAYLRQGEWFFVPAEDVDPPAGLVLRNEPLRRGMGKTHWLELAFRRGGELVYVNHEHPAGIDAQKFARLSERDRRDGGWTPMRRDPELYARGTVRHSDHATLVLPGWHRVLMNTERGARAMRHVAFLD